MSLTIDPVVPSHVVLTEGRQVRRVPGGPAPTIRWVAGINLVFVLTLFCAAYAIGARVAEDQALRDASLLTRFVGNTMVGPRVSGSRGAGDPSVVRILDGVFHDGLVKHTPIVRIKLWSADGRVLYSDDHGEIGRTVTLEPQLRALVEGRVDAVAEVSDMDDAADAENFEDRLLGSRLLESYSRVTLPDGSPVLFEAYLDYRDLEDRRTAVFAALGVLSGVLITVFATVQVWLGGTNLRWLRRRQADLELLSADVNDRERRRVARDLHDGPVQDLVGVAMLTEGAAACLRMGDSGRAARTLELCVAQTHSSVQALRASIVEVYPHVLQDHGLGVALEDLTQPLRSRGVRVTVRVEDEQSLPTSLLAITYRTAQELVRNVSRHAQATQVDLAVLTTTDGLRLVVTDDGVGLDCDRLSERNSSCGHLGLQALADSAAELGGRMEIVAGPGAGTTVIWEVPR